MLPESVAEGFRGGEQEIRLFENIQFCLRARGHSSINQPQKQMDFVDGAGAFSDHGTLYQEIKQLRKTGAGQPVPP